MAERKKKHTPGRDHDWKSRAGKVKRFAKKALQKQQQRLKEAERQWKVWDDLTDEQKKFREDLRPTYPRPIDDKDT